MPTEDWLCKKIGKLNLTLVEGYPSRSSEAGGLLMDQFLRTAKSQSKWYGLSSDHKADPAAVSSWSTEFSKLNSCYSRIAGQSGLTSTPPPPPCIQTHFTGSPEKMGKVSQRSHSHLQSGCQL